MTSLVATDSTILTPIDKERSLLADKNGYPLNRQIPRTQTNYTGNGAAPITFDGNNHLSITGALAGALTINATTVTNLIGRSITVFVRGGVGQNVVINFPAATYLTYVRGAAGAATSYTFTASANNQSAVIEFAPLHAVVSV